MSQSINLIIISNELAIVKLKLNVLLIKKKLIVWALQKWQINKTISTFSRDSQKNPGRSLDPTVRTTCVHKLAHAHIIQLRWPESDIEGNYDVNLGIKYFFKNLLFSGVDLRGSGEIRQGPKVCVSDQTRNRRRLRDDHRWDGQRRQ